MKEIKAELDELEQDQLNERLSGAEHAPVHLPAKTGVQRASFMMTLIQGTYLLAPLETPVALEDDEEAQLRELQAELAM